MTHMKNGHPPDPEELTWNQIGAYLNQIAGYCEAAEKWGFNAGYRLDPGQMPLLIITAKEAYLR